jgi:hypothetical protein
MVQGGEKRGKREERTGLGKGRKKRGRYRVGKREECTGLGKGKKRAEGTG